MTCIVSAYFKIPSKQTHEWYLPHVVRFLNGVRRENIIFFTSDDVLEDLKPLVNLSGIKFIIMDFNNLNAFKQYGYEFWQRQYSRDPEKYHSPELAAIWYEKKEFVLKAFEYIKSDVYIWCDAGCVRDDTSSYLLQQFGTRSFDLNDGKIHLQQVGIIKRNKYYIFTNGTCIAGAIISGNIESWNKYKIIYDETLLDYDGHNICGTSDQYITLSCVDKNPELFKLYTDNSNCDEWFKFLELI